LNAATYNVTVAPGSTIDIGGTTVSGACFSFATATGTHNHIARASGATLVDVTVVESGIPAGQEFVSVDKYQKTGGPSGAVALTSSAVNTVTAQVGGTGGSTITSLVGANVVFYNRNIPRSAPSLAILKTADAASVSAGSNIGFGITVNSNGPGTADAVTLSDPLPAGSGLAWTIDAQPAGNPCSITANVLSCSFGDMASGTSATVHVTSPTTAASCAAYPNTASVSATNHATLTSTASTTVNCPSLTVLKTAGAATVTAGSPISFSIKVSSNGPGTATGVTLSDPLPTGSGIVWSISSQPAGNPCTITAGVLGCSFGDMASGTDATVSVSSPTTTASCKAYPNTASASATNHATVTSTATTTVDCPPQWGDETAVSAGTRWPGTSNWFMYMAYTTSKVDLIAGQNYDAGDIFMSRSGGNTIITIVLTNSSWRWAPVSDNLKIIPMNSAPTTYVSPGQFPYKFTVSGSTVTVTIPGTSAKFYGIHGDVQRLLP
jgi:uncharacterized repeat protein (TIGR01451 family)